MTAKSKKNIQEVTVISRYENKGICYLEFNGTRYGIMFEDPNNCYPVGSKVNIISTGTIGKSNFNFEVKNVE